MDFDSPFEDTVKLFTTPPPDQKAFAQRMKQIGDWRCPPLPKMSNPATATKE